MNTNVTSSIVIYLIIAAGFFIYSLGYENALVERNLWRRRYFGEMMAEIFRCLLWPLIILVKLVDAALGFK